MKGSILLVLTKKSKIKIFADTSLKYILSDFETITPNEPLFKEPLLKEILSNAEIIEITDISDRIKFINDERTVPSYSKYLALDKINGEDMVNLPSNEGISEYQMYQIDNIVVLKSFDDHNTDIASIENGIITITYLDNTKVSFRIVKSF